MKKLYWLALLVPVAVFAAAGYPIGGDSFKSNDPTAATVKMLHGSAVIDVAAITAGTCNDNQVTLTGAIAGVPCVVGFSGKTTGVAFTCRVSATSTVQLMSCSPVAADPASQTYNFVVFNN